MSATSADKPVAPADRAFAPAFAACRVALVSMIELADPLDLILRRDAQWGVDVRLPRQNVNKRILFGRKFFRALHIGRAPFDMRPSSRACRGTAQAQGEDELLMALRKSSSS
jgi:hypothetical protein